MKYEYKRILASGLSESQESEFNKLGLENWELVSGSGPTFWFKRPLQSTPTEAVKQPPPAPEVSTLKKPISEMTLEELQEHDRRRTLERSKFFSATPTDMTPMPTDEELVDLYTKQGSDESQPFLIGSMILLDKLNNAEKDSKDVNDGDQPPSLDDLILDDMYEPAEIRLMEELTGLKGHEAIVKFEYTMDQYSAILS